MEATLPVVLLCAGFYMHRLIHKSPERDGIDFFFFLVPFTEKMTNSERLGNLSKATQLVRNIDGI